LLEKGQEKEENKWHRLFLKTYNKLWLKNFNFVLLAKGEIWQKNSKQF